MHSALTRLQNVFGFFTTVAFGICVLAAVSVLLHPGNPSAEVSLTNIQVVRGRPHYYSTKKEEYAHIKFDLDADFSSLFNWNTKQLFVYVLARYPTSSPSPASTVPVFSDAIIWDMIIPAPISPYSYATLKEKYLPKATTQVLSGRSKSSSSKTKRSPETKDPAKPGILTLRNQKPKYQITDVGGKIAELQNATLVVGWNVQPWVGVLQWDGYSVGDWTAGKTGHSRQTFDFPALKGAKKTETPSFSGSES